MPSRPNRKTRVLVTGIYQETNTFCPLPTTMDHFTVLYGEAALRDRCFRALVNDDVELIPSVHAYAPPFGAVTQDAYKTIPSEILMHVRSTHDLDGVYLDLHGALHVNGYEDAQADLVASLHRILGKDILIAASLDLHSTATDALIEQIDIVTAYRTAPHVDIQATRVRAVKLLCDALCRGKRPVGVRVRIPALFSGDRAITDLEPLASIYAQLPNVSARERILDTSILVGMAWADLPCASASALLMAEDITAVEVARKEAQKLAESVWKARERMHFDAEVETLDGALTTALDAPEPTVFVSDSGYNVTGGGSDESTLALELLMSRNIKNALVAGLVNSAAVAACEAAGVGRQMIGSRFSGIAVRKTEIAASGPLVPAFKGPQRRPERQTDRAWCF